MNATGRHRDESENALTQNDKESKIEETNPITVQSESVLPAPFEDEALPKPFEDVSLNDEEISSRAETSEVQRVGLRNKAILAIIAASVLILGVVTAFALSSSNPRVPEALKTVTAGSDNSAICESFVQASLGCDVTWLPNATEKRGALLNQSIAAGSSVDADTKVVLTYSSGPATSEMPNLKNKTVAEAEAALYEMNVSVSEIKEIPGADIPKGNVISSSVAAGTKVENGSSVILSVSNGKAGVPNWSDKTKEFVETDAKKLGLEVNFVYEESEKASDLVLSQTPAAGEVSSEDKVKVVLSKSFASKDIKVPDVIGKAAVSAQAELAAAGFRHIKTVTVTNSEVTSTQVTQVVPGVGQIGKSEENLVIIVSSPSK